MQIIVLSVVSIIGMAVIAYTMYNTGQDAVERKVLKRLSIVNEQFGAVAITALRSWSPRHGNEPEEKKLDSLQRCTKQDYMMLWNNVMYILDREPEKLTSYQKRCK